MSCTTTYRYHAGHQLRVDTFVGPGPDFRSTDLQVHVRVVCLLPAPHYKLEGHAFAVKGKGDPTETAVARVVAMLDAALAA